MKKCMLSLCLLFLVAIATPAYGWTQAQAIGRKALAESKIEEASDEWGRCDVKRRLLYTWITNLNNDYQVTATGVDFNDWQSIIDLKWLDQGLVSPCVQFNVNQGDLAANAYDLNAGDILYNAPNYNYTGAYEAYDDELAKATAAFDYYRLGYIRASASFIEIITLINHEVSPPWDLYRSCQDVHDSIVEPLYGGLAKLDLAVTVEGVLKQSVYDQMIAFEGYTLEEVTWIWGSYGSAVDYRNDTCLPEHVTLMFNWNLAKKMLADGKPKYEVFDFAAAEDLFDMADWWYNDPSAMGYGEEEFQTNLENFNTLQSLWSELETDVNLCIDNEECQVCWQIPCIAEGEGGGPE